MDGSKNSALLFLLAAISLVVQAVVSSAIFDDWMGAFIAGAFAFIMIMGMLMAYSGGLSAVMNTTTTRTPNYGTGTETVTTTYTDTGERMQMTPCCGIGGGIMIIVVLMIFGEGVSGSDIFLLAPGFVAAILAFLAAIVFIIEYKGSWTGTAF